MLVPFALICIANIGIYLPNLLTKVLLLADPYLPQSFQSAMLEEKARARLEGGTPDRLKMKITQL